MKSRFFLILVTLGFLGGPAWADSFQVPLDHARVMRLSRPAAAVIVGNAAIADAAIHDGRTLFITGKTLGATNFIALDAEGRTIVSRNLTVKPSVNRLTLHRGSYQRSFQCEDGCEPVPGIGDDADSFDRLMTQHKEKADEGSTAAETN